MELELLIPRGAPHPQKVRLHEWYTRLGYRQIRPAGLRRAAARRAPPTCGSTARTCARRPRPERLPGRSRRSLSNNAVMPSSRGEVVMPSGLRDRSAAQVKVLCTHMSRGGRTSLPAVRCATGAVGILEAREQQLDGARAELGRRLADDGQPRARTGRPTRSRRSATSARSSGTRQAALGDRAQQADGHEVVAADDRGGRVGEVEQRVHRLARPGRAGSRPRRRSAGSNGEPARSSASR